jgi:hypothetical protein
VLEVQIAVRVDGASRLDAGARSGSACSAANARSVLARRSEQLRRRELASVQRALQALVAGRVQRASHGFARERRRRAERVRRVETRDQRASASHPRGAELSRVEQRRAHRGDREAAHHDAVLAHVGRGDPAVGPIRG